MLINELLMNPDGCFTNIQCKMTIKRKIIAKNGRVEMFGDNQFKFISKDNVIDFSVSDTNESKLIMESFNRHLYCLAYITNSGNKDDAGKVFFMHLGFFYNFAENFRRRWKRRSFLR